MATQEQGPKNGPMKDTVPLVPGGANEHALNGGFTWIDGDEQDKPLVDLAHKIENNPSSKDEHVLREEPSRN